MSTPIASTPLLYSHSVVHAYPQPLSSRVSPVLSSRSGTAAPKSLIRYKVNSALCGLNGDEYPGEKKFGSSTFALIPISARLYDAPPSATDDSVPVGPALSASTRSLGRPLRAVLETASIAFSDREGDRAAAPAGTRQRETSVRTTGRSADRARLRPRSRARQARDSRHGAREET